MDYETREYEIGRQRFISYVVIDWPNGGFVSSYNHSDFSSAVARMCERYGPPVNVRRKLCILGQGKMPCEY